MLYSVWCNHVVSVLLLFVTFVYQSHAKERDLALYCGGTFLIPNLSLNILIKQFLHVGIYSCMCYDRSRTEYSIYMS